MGCCHGFVGIDEDCGIADAEHGEICAAVGVADIGVVDAKLMVQANVFVGSLVVAGRFNTREEGDASRHFHGGADGVGEPERGADQLCPPIRGGRAEHGGVSLGVVLCNFCSQRGIDSGENFLLYKGLALLLQCFFAQAPGIREEYALHLLRVEDAQGAQDSTRQYNQEVESAPAVPFENPAGKSKLRIPGKEGAIHVEECYHLLYVNLW